MLRSRGLVLVRTITPEDAVERVPGRQVRATAEADAARLPSLDTIVAWLEQAGFVDVRVECHRRNKELTLAEQERELRTEVAHRYKFIADDEVEAALARMRADAARGIGLTRGRRRSSSPRSRNPGLAGDPSGWPNPRRNFRRDRQATKALCRRD